MLALTCQRESSSLIDYWSESTLSSRWFGRPASRHESLNPLFQVVLYLPFYHPSHLSLKTLALHCDKATKNVLACGGVVVRGGEPTRVGVSERRIRDLLRARAKCYFSSRILLLFSSRIGNFWRDFPQIMNFDLQWCGRARPFEPRSKVHLGQCQLLAINARKVAPTMNLFLQNGS